MKQPVFQSLLVDHILSLILLQRIFSEVPVLMLLYSLVDHLHIWKKTYVEDFFSRFRVPLII